MLQKFSNFLNNKSSVTIKRKRIASVLVFLGVVLALIYLLPWQDINDVFQKADLAKIALAVLILLPVQYLVAMSYQLMAQSQNMGISAVRFMLINLIIGFYQLFIPASFFGSGLRWVRYSGYSKKPAQSFAIIAYYKVFNIFLVLLLSSGFLFFNETDSIKITSLQVIVLLVLITVLLLLIPSISQFLLDHIKPMDESVKSKKLGYLIIKTAQKTLLAFTNFKQLQLSSQLKIIIYGIFAQLLQILTYWIIASALGITLSFAQLGIMRATLLLAANLPLNITPGIGIREVSLVALLVAMNVELEYAAAMSIIIFARSVFYGLVGGVVEGVQLVFDKKINPVEKNQ
jgi:uncharacterized protein (TIRG00374 family)